VTAAGLAPDWRARGGSSIVMTGMTIAASAASVWEGLMFYEQVPGRPPLHLRLLLPSPKRAERGRSIVGAETRCLYEKGHLLKRVTGIELGRSYGFDIVEQDLAIGSGIRLMGGGYTLRELPDGTTRLGIETRYVSPSRPRWLWSRVEAAVCHAFHRHILGAMRRTLEARGSTRR